MKLRFSLFSFFVLLADSLPGGAQQTPSTIRVGVALYQQNDTFISTVAQNLQQFALEEETHNIKINLSIVDGRSSQSVQNEQVDRFLDQDYDVLCVNMVDRTAAAVIIDKAQAVGIPVIFFNREPVLEDLAPLGHAYYVGLPG